MDSLIQDLQKTIEALESLGSQPATAGEQADELLDQLFQHKIDLVHATLNTTSPLFQQAATAMKQAAAKAAKAVKEPALFDAAVKAIALAIHQLAKLLDNTASLHD